MRDLYGVREKFCGKCWTRAPLKVKVDSGMLFKPKHARLRHDSPRGCIRCSPSAMHGCTCTCPRPCSWCVGSGSLPEPIFFGSWARTTMFKHMFFLKKIYRKVFWVHYKKKFEINFIYIHPKKVWSSVPHVLQDQGQMSILSDVQARILDGWINFICKL